MSKVLLVGFRARIRCVACIESKRICYHASTLPPAPEGIPVRCANCILDESDCVFDIILSSIKPSDPSALLPLEPRTPASSTLITDPHPLAPSRKYLRVPLAVVYFSDYDPALDDNRFHLSMIHFDEFQNVTPHQRARVKSPTEDDVIEGRMWVWQIGELRIGRDGYEVSRKPRTGAIRRQREEDVERDLTAFKRAKVDGEGVEDNAAVRARWMITGEEVNQNLLTTSANLDNS